jgi:HlyD family secretion protein
MATTLTEPRAETSARSKQSSKTAPPAKRTGMKVFSFGLAVVFLSGLAAVATTWKGSGSTATDLQSAIVSPHTFNVVLKEKGELKAAKSTDIKCEVEGRSTIISLIPEGTAVQQGDLLVTLASDEIENKIRESELKEANAITNFESAKTELDIQRDKNASDIRKAELQIELKGLDLKKYQEGDWAQKQKDAQVAIQQAEITLERRKQDFEASQKLYEKKYTTQTEYEEAEFNFKKAGWDLEKAKMALEVLNKYTHIADSKLKTSDLEEAQKEAERVRKNAEAEEIKKLRNVEGREKELALIQDQLAKLRTQKEKCRIVAPTQGFVVYYSGGGGGGRMMMNNDQQIKEGAEVFERQILMQLPDTSSMMVAVRIHEAKTDKLRLEQPVNVTIEGIPGRSFPGKVRKIAALADSQSSWLNPDLKEYETEILLDPTDVPLKPGVTAQAEIMVTTVEDQLAIPVQAIYAKSGKRFVFRQNGKAAEPVPVQVGPVGNEWAAIASGLEAGDRVLMAFTDDHRRMIPDATGGEERSAGGGQRRKGPGGPGGARPGGPGGSRPGGAPAGAPVKQTSTETQKPAEVAVKPVDAKDSDTAKTPEISKPASGESDRTSGKSP